MGKMTSPETKPRLRLITYMCPSHPVELYEMLLVYLEETLDCEATLVYESRAPGPLPDRVDPFTNDSVDIGQYLNSCTPTSPHLPNVAFIIFLVAHV